MASVTSRSGGLLYRIAAGQNVRQLHRVVVTLQFTLIAYVNNIMYNSLRDFSNKLRFMFVFLFRVVIAILLYVC